MRINYLKLKTGETIELHNKITVFVGPNNSGKSQTLKDIRCLLDRQQSPFKSPVILEDDNRCFALPTLDEIKARVHFRPSRSNADCYYIEGASSDLINKRGFDIFKPDIDNYDGAQNKEYVFFTWFSNFFIALMDAETRLSLASESSSFTPDEEAPSNLIQSLFLSQDTEILLRDAFKRAFSQDLKLDISQLIKICIRVGDNVNNIPEDARIAFSIAKDIPKIDTQGDGFRSFAGIILGLLLCKERIVLLDEPEAFLHPAQAYYLGKWIGEHQDLFGPQILICTHSSNFLSGILSGTQDLNIIRLRREGDHTFYSSFEREIAHQLINNPILSSQRVIEGIFHKGVVICEADADRAVYQSVASICHDSNREILFIHSHNKQTLALVAKALKQTDTPVSIIADIDILRPEKDLSEIYQVLSNHTMDSDLNQLWKDLDHCIDQRKEEDVLMELKEKVDEFAAQLSKGEHTLEGARGALSRISRETTKWSAIKRGGIAALSGEQQIIAKRLISHLSHVGLFVVPVGELEGWISIEGISKKNKWIIPALETINNHKTPKGLEVFVGDVLSSFKERSRLYPERISSQ